jgi:predicted DNA-binding ribbon-helix-helix protein
VSLRKRSITLRGHRTSIALEEPFWEVLETWAAGDGRPLAALVADIDARRTAEQSLASALRLAALDHVRRGEHGADG